MLARTHILIVGGRSNGGRAVLARMCGDDPFRVTALVRAPAVVADGPDETLVRVDDYFAGGISAANAIDAVVNFTGVTTNQYEAAIARVNVDGPTVLAAAAKAHGLRQFVHMSSLSVGNAQDIDNETPELPVGADGHSKLAGDRKLLALADDGFAVTLVPMPTLYGPNVGAKLRQLAGAMRRLGWFATPRVSQPAVNAAFEKSRHRLRRGDRATGHRHQFAVDPKPFHLKALARVIAREQGRPRAVAATARFRVLASQDCGAWRVSKSVW